MDNIVYKNSEELENLGFSDFINYCNCVNTNLEKPLEDGDKRIALDVSVMVKVEEDRRIMFALKTFHDKYQILGFRFDVPFGVTICDDDWVEKDVLVSKIVLSESDDTYTIYDSCGERIPFSFIINHGVVVDKLYITMGEWLRVNENTIKVNE